MRSDRAGRILMVSLVSAAISVFSACAAQAGDHPPKVDTSFNNPQPPYPDSAQTGGEAGTVLLNVYVRSSGRPTKVSVVQSSGFEDLDTAAVQGVLNWHFVPAERDGDFVGDWTTVKIVYNLPTLVPPSAPNRP